MTAHNDRELEAPKLPVVKGEAPEFGSDRRKFLVAMLMLGAIPPQRVVDRIVDEVEHEAAQ
jgi:hypothetical protein